MGIPLDKAELLALFLENIMYGVFLTFYILLLVISFGEKDISIANQRFILPVATLMLALATTHLSIDFARAIQAFVTGTTARLPNPIAYYPPVNTPLHVAKQVVYALQTLLGDSVLIWRCYVVYNKKLYILIPAIIIILGDLGLIAVLTWSFCTAGGNTNIFETALREITAFFIITMTLNVGCTAAIAYKIWLTRRHAPSTSRSLFPVIAVIIESGALYSASVLALLVSYLCKSNGQYAALDLVTPLVGVTYCLIVLQIHFHLKLSSPSTARGGTSNWSIPQSWRRRSPHDDTTILGSDSKSYALQSGVAVRITEHAETHREPDFQHKAAHFNDTGSEC